MTNDFTLTDDLLARLKAVKVADLSDGALDSGFQAQAAGPQLRPAVPYSSLIGIAMPVRCFLAEGERSYTDQVLDLYERGRPTRHAIVVQQNDVPGFTSIGSGGARIAAAHDYDGWITSAALRDTDDLRHMDWPIYGTSVVPAGRRVVDLPAGQSFQFTFDEPVDIAGMRVSPGDIVVGDNDGVIAFPPDRLMAMLEGAEAILRVEHRYYRLIDEGRTFRDIIESDRAAGPTE